jgi:hypothetical protein
MFKNDIMRIQIIPHSQDGTLEIFPKNCQEFLLCRIKLYDKHMPHISEQEK